MRLVLVSFIVILFSCRNESKYPSKIAKEIPNPIIQEDVESEPTYQETINWILEKLNLYVTGYEMDYYPNSEFEELYPQVKMTYSDIKMQFGKVWIIESYRYFGANLAKENKYNGYILRQNTQEVSINDIEHIEFLENKSFCIIKFITKTKAVKFTRNLQLKDDYDKDVPLPIIEYESKGGIYIRCETENDFENRLKKAFSHLKKLNLQRYPIKKEDF